MSPLEWPAAASSPLPPAIPIRDGWPPPEKLRDTAHPCLRPAAHPHPAAFSRCASSPQIPSRISQRLFSRHRLASSSPPRAIPSETTAESSPLSMVHPEIHAQPAAAAPNTPPPPHCSCRTFHVPG